LIEKYDTSVQLQLVVIMQINVQSNKTEIKLHMLATCRPV